MTDSLRALVEAVREARRVADRRPCECADGSSICMRCHDESNAEADLATALLSDPSVLDAYEAVRALGVARAQDWAADDALIRDPSDEHAQAWAVAFVALKKSNDVMCALADRLAKGTDR